MFFSKLAKLMVSLPLLAHLYSCQKPSVTGQSQTGGGGGSGSGGETVEKVDFELIGSVSEEDPGDLGNSSSSEVSGSLNLVAGSGYQISVLSISPDGKKNLEHESVSASRSFKLNFQVPKRYLALEVLRRADNRKFKAILPPPTTAKTASVNFDKTSTIAGVILDKVGSNAASGNQAAVEALANHSVSVADIMKIAQSVRRTIDEQKSHGVASAIDISPVASSITTKSNERLASLQSGDLSASSLASKISDATYTDLFGRGAEIIPPGVLAHLVDHKLGAASAATTDVAYEAIKGSTTLPMKQAAEAFKAEADAFRGASNLSDALVAEQQVATNFANRFNDCILTPASCAATAYVSPAPPSIIASIPSDGALNLPDALAPESSVLDGSYMTAQAVTVTSGTSGATIYYTTDGSSPSASSSVYSTPILVQVSQTIKAIAVKSGYQNSGVGTFSYTITGTVQAPSFSVATGGYGPAQSVTLSSATPGASIYYTTNGDAPSRSSSLYSGAITVSSSQTLKAFAVLDGWADSQASSAQYTINGQASAPTFSVTSGTYTSAQSVTLSSATSGALIYYTTNGDTPSASSSLYSGAISVGSSMTIKVIAVKSGYSNSNVNMGEYTLNIPLPLATTPSASQASGTYTTAKTVTLSSATAGATIYYTTNDSVPTTSSSVYSAPILVQVSQTIKAIAVKSGYQNSSVGTFAYIITGTVQSPTFSVPAAGYGPAQSVTLSSATPGASIYYTTNGDAPSRSSSLYSGAITVSSSQTLKAFAVLDGWADSQASSAQYTINGQVAAPSLSVASGTYTSQQSVTLSTATSGALIYYTTNGETPSASSTLYSGAISVGSSMTIKAIAIKATFSNSSVSEAEYTINIPLPVAVVPVASPAAGTYTSAQSVSLSSGTSGATIYYTTDNSPPSTSSIVYSSPFLVQVSQTIKAIAVKSGYQNSSVETFGYTITGTVQSPTFSVPAAGYGPAQSVTLSSATPGASIYYTTNGDAPSRSSSLYSGAITVSSSQTLKAFAVLDGWADSQPSSAQYTINGQASAPTFSVTSGTYTSAQSVTLSSATADALIYYTVNGDTPSVSSTLYSGAISVGSSMTIKAFAMKATYSSSSIAEETYTMNTSGGSSIPVSALVVAGGGGGGTDQDGGGGGGAGGLLSGTFLLTEQDVLNVTVGSGGINGVNGQNSVFSSFTANGGGYGGNNTEPNGGNGGSGGGQGRDGCGTAGTGTVGQGNNGGDTGCGGWNAGGGGGGAGEAGYYGGSDYNGVSDTASKGGDGVASSITGTSTYYAGGGGGGHNGSASGNAAQGGLGGGGNGTDSTGQNGQANTGGGGGGGRNGAGGTGGSGVVVVAYPNTFPDLAVSSSLTYTQPTRAGYKVYRFTAGSGSIAVQNQTSAPNAPTSVTAVAGNEQVSLSWAAAFSAGPSVSDYVIEYSSDSGANWTAFSHSASIATTAIIAGLTNDTAYLFRVAAVNSVGTGPYATSSGVTPNLFVITTQPKNDYATASNQNVTFSVDVVGGGTPTYQWQYFGPNFNTGDYNDLWRDIPEATSSSYTTNGNTLSSSTLLDYGFYYNGASAKLRCIVTATGGTPALTSDIVRFLQLDALHYPSVYWYGSQGAYPNYGQPQTVSMSPDEILVLDLYDYAMSYADTSWYTGNDTTVKVQVATTGYTDSADWTDLYTVDSRGYFYLYGYQIPPSTGTKYYRVIAVNKWPYTVNNGTQSATHATQYIYPHSNYDVVQVTWP